LLEQLWEIPDWSRVLRADTVFIKKQIALMTTTEMKVRALTMLSANPQLVADFRGLLEDYAAGRSQNLRLAAQSALAQAQTPVVEQQETPTELPDYDPLPTPALPPNVLEILEDVVRAAKATVAAKHLDPKGWDLVARAARTPHDELVTFAKILTDDTGGWLRIKTPRYTVVTILEQTPQLHLGFEHLLRLLWPQDHALGALARFSSMFLDDAHSPQFKDLRAVKDVMVSAGIPNPEFTAAMFYINWRNEFVNEHYGPPILPDQAWPLFIENPDVLQQIMGMKAMPRSAMPYWLTQTDLLPFGLELLAAMPAPPAEYWPRITELALTPSKTYQALAQQAAAKIPGIRATIEESLGSRIQSERSSAARWLGRLGDPQSEPALRRAAATESNPAVKAEILAALSDSGVDISEWLSPDTLTADAHKGLKRKLPKDIEWFPFDALPGLTWADGSPVDPVVPQWWTILACTLKEATPNALLDLYLEQLDPASAVALGNFALDGFVAFDLRTISESEAREYADLAAPRKLANQQKFHKQWPDRYPEPEPIEVIHQRFLKERMNEHVGSAMKAKGILALASHCDPARLVGAFVNYEKNHSVRRGQMTALVQAATNRDDPEILQLLLRLAQRFRMATIQNLAAQLIAQAATRLNWTEAELADRTVPTAGFDEKGILVLDYGPRQFTAVLTPDLKIELRNSEGKTIKALPAANANDDPEAVAAAKKQLSTTKKELAALAKSQLARLDDAMVAERRWAVADWRNDLLEHPIMGRLAARIVWQWLDADGAALGSFRPEPDGSLVASTDDDFDLGDSGLIRIAHQADLGDADSGAWQQHLADYKLTPALHQFGFEPLPPTDPDARAYTDREGWVIGNRALAGAAKKLGYVPGAREDGGVYYSYDRSYKALDLVVQLEFTGDFDQSESYSVAVTQLSFQKSSARNPELLTDVPKRLLMSAHDDYLTAAAKGSFDQNWRTALHW
jgi:hypothetical protein